jgi:hypothetical protein
MRKGNNLLYKVGFIIEKNEYGYYAFYPEL